MLWSEFAGFYAGTLRSEWTKTAKFISLIPCAIPIAISSLLSISGVGGPCLLVAAALGLGMSSPDDGGTAAAGLAAASGFVGAGGSGTATGCGVPDPEIIVDAPVP